jgi:hypothetical protein
MDEDDLFLVQFVGGLPKTPRYASRGDGAQISRFRLISPVTNKGCHHEETQHHHQA